MSRQPNTRGSWRYLFRLRPFWLLSMESSENAKAQFARWPFQRTAGTLPREATTTQCVCGTCKREKRAFSDNVISASPVFPMWLQLAFLPVADTSPRAVAIRRCASGMFKLTRCVFWEDVMTQFALWLSHQAGRASLPEVMMGAYTSGTFKQASHVFWESATA